MSAIKSHHSRLFEQLMAEHRASLVEAIASGIPMDYAGYRAMVGRLEGIDDALRICEQADYKLSGDEH